MGYTCADPLLDEIYALLGSKDSAEYVCENYDCTTLGAEACSIIYLAGKGQTTYQNAPLGQVALGLDVCFLLFSAYLVFMMQTGFAMLAAGCIRSKNALNILLKNVLDSCIGAIAWYVLGYGFAFGRKDELKESHRFIGSWNYALTKTTTISRVLDDTYAFADEMTFSGTGWAHYLFQWSFAAAATTIVSGAVAERCGFIAYLGYAFFISAFIYPVIVHWHWSADGFNSAFNVNEDGRGFIMKIGAIDFAGSGVVHMTGGVAALMGAWIIGPRIGRFDPSGRVMEMRGHSATLVVVGTFLLWFGWYGFNPGSNLIISSHYGAATVSRVAVTTTLSAAAGGITVLFYKYFRFHIWDTAAVCNGVLAGLVAITSPCAVVEPWAAIICGGCAGLYMYFGEWLVLHVLKIDDPVSAVAVHMFGGSFGVFFCGLMAKPRYVYEVYGIFAFKDVYGEKAYGAFYGGSGKLLGCQMIEIALVFGWTATLMGAFFYIMKVCKLLRVPVEVELAGLDISKHGGSAYDAGEASKVAAIEA